MLALVIDSILLEQIYKKSKINVFRQRCCQQISEIYILFGNWRQIWPANFKIILRH